MCRGIRKYPLKELIVYLSNNADIKSWTSKRHYTVADCGEIKTIKMVQNFDQNATLYLAVNPEEYIFFKHSCFHRRECFIGSTPFIRVHCTRGGAFISCNVGSLMNEWHWLYLCPLTLFFELPYTFFKSFHMSDCFTEYSGLVNLELKTFHSWWVTD